MSRAGASRRAAAFRGPLAALLCAALSGGGPPSPAAAQPPNVRVSSPLSVDPEETTIALNPSHPLFLAGGANIAYRYVSTDGGLSWSEDYLTSTLGVAGDPVVIYDLYDHLLYAHLSAPETGEWLDRIVVQRSTDGGFTWNDGAGVGFHPPRDQDKPGLGTDLTDSPYRGHTYLAWTEFDGYGSTDPADSTRVMFSRSTDGGVSWSAPLRLSDAGGNCLDGDATVEGAIPAVGPDGQVYVAWSGPDGIWLDRSFDGGASFGNDVFVAAQPGGWDFDVSGIFRANGLPTTLSDASASPYRGRVYVMWSDQRAGVSDTDIWMARSGDEGQSWSAPVRVNGDATASQQFFPAAALDPTTGILYVAYYDRSLTAGDATDVVLAHSTDGGQTFTSQRVSESSFTPQDGTFFGDYIGITAYDRHVHAMWMRLEESGELAVWTTQIAETATVVAVAERGPGGPALLPAYPQPFRAATRIGYALPAAGRVAIRIVDVQGRALRTLVDGWQPAGEHRVEWDAREVPAGVYFVTLASGAVTRSQKLVHIR